LAGLGAEEEEEGRANSKKGREEELTNLRSVVLLAC